MTAVLRAGLPWHPGRDLHQSTCSDRRDRCHVGVQPETQRRRTSQDPGKRQDTARSSRRSQDVISAIHLILRPSRPRPSRDYPQHLCVPARRRPSVVVPTVRRLIIITCPRTCALPVHVPVHSFPVWRCFTYIRRVSYGSCSQSSVFVVMWLPYEYNISHAVSR